jgi:ABC-type amino acid transport substrate-binding protein
MRRPYTRLLIAAVLAVGCSTGLAARADDLPADTNTIEGLTVEQARKLVKEFSGVEFTKITKQGYSFGMGECLPLNSLKTLDAVTAEVLAGWRGHLLLDGLTRLDPDVARALAKHEGGDLHFDGLTTLDADTAEALAIGNVSRRLFLNGLTTLDAPKAKSLSKFSEVVLNGLATLDADTARALVDSGKRREGGGQLWLDGLTTLDADTARALAGFSGGFLRLDGLGRLDAATARALVEEFQGSFLLLNGLKRLDAGAAAALAGVRGTDVTITTNEKIAEIIWPPIGPGNPLTPENAGTVSQRDLERLTAIESPDSVAIARALAARGGLLQLNNLKRISPRTLAVLLEKADIEIPPIETLELIPEPDGSPNDDFVIPEGF